MLAAILRIQLYCWPARKKSLLLIIVATDQWPLASYGVRQTLPASLDKYTLLYQKRIYYRM